MASIVTLHKCEYCSYTAKTRKAVTSHENKCSKNPKNIAATKQLSALNQEIEDISTAKPFSKKLPLSWYQSKLRLTIRRLYVPYTQKRKR